MTVAAPSFDEEYVRFVSDPLDDPRDFYARLRAAHPVYRTPHGYWFVTDFALGEAIWKDTDNWVRRPVNAGPSHPLTSGDGPAAKFLTQHILAQDGDPHRRIRGLVNKVFSPAGIAKLNDTIQGTVDSLFDGVMDNREMEFIGEFGLKLPTMVILDVFDLDHSEYGRFIETSDTLIECFGAMSSANPPEGLVERADRVVSDTADFIFRVADERRGGDGEDLLSELVRSQDAEPEALSPTELSSLVMFLVTAGFETTTYTAANALLSFFKFPGQFELLRLDPSLARSAVEEVLRYEPGVTVSSTLFAARDQVIAGEEIKRGDRMLISNHAANHDLAAFDDPLRFDITRKPNRQMSFGRGPHSCLGANLARTELTLFFRALVERMPEVRAAAPSEEIPWRHSHVIRGPERLQLRW